MTSAGAGPASRPGDGLRALGLFGVAFAFSLVRPSVLVGVPLVALVLVLPTVRPLAWGVAAFAAFLAFGGARSDGLWYAERGWAILIAGWFVALTLRWPSLHAFPRAALSVLASAAIAALVVGGAPAGLETLDHLVGERVQAGVLAGIEAMRLLSAEGSGPSPALLAAVQGAAELQVQVFPALLALASIASLGLAWWIHARLLRTEGPALLPVREFRFNEHLVWVFISGLALLLVGWGGAWGRAGANAVAFMSALYVLRGFGVAMFAAGGVSFFGAALLLLAFVFVAPVMLAIALVIGLGDTWVDLRGRLARAAALRGP